MKTIISMAVVLPVLIAGPAWADADQGAIASGTVAAAAIEGTTTTAIAGAVGYRFNRAIGMQVEVTWMPTLKPDGAALSGSSVVTSNGAIFIGGGPSGGIASPGITATDGRSAVVATTMRIEIPTTSRRVILSLARVFEHRQVVLAADGQDGVEIGRRAAQMHRQDQVQHKETARFRAEEQ